MEYGIGKSTPRTTEVNFTLYWSIFTPT